MITIRETQKADISKVQALWENGEVMKFVGFPDGLHQSDEEMQKWYAWIEESRPNINHYCIFHDDTYCGETFYKIDPEHQNHASMDIKLFPFARGKGIAAIGLSYAIQEAFRHGAAAVWVDPDPKNQKAIALYKRLGFVEKPLPDHLRYDGFEQVYFELTRAVWQESHQSSDSK